MEKPVRMEDDTSSIKRKNLLSRTFQNIWKKIDKDDVLNPVQKLAFDIFKISLNDENNIRYLNVGMSYKKYIVSKQYVINNEINTFLILESGKLTIVNHQYRYDIDLPEKTSSKMSRMFDDKVKEDRDKMEKEILGNITSSLQIVLEEFKSRLEGTKEYDN
jgi:hypothetical protein